MENIKINFPKNQMLPHGYAVEWLPSEERYWFTTPDKNFESDLYSCRFMARRACLSFITKQNPV